MNRITKAIVATGATALVTLTAASPAQAQYYPQSNGIDVGQIVRGIGTAVAVGAIANAVRGRSNGGYSNGGYGVYGNGGYNNGGYGVYGNGTYGNGTYGNGSYGNQGYGYGNQNAEQYAVSACAAQAQRYGRISITDVDRRSSRTLRVRGVIDANNGYGNQSYGGYGNYGDYQRRTFSCSVRSDGRITDFDLGRARY